MQRATIPEKCRKLRERYGVSNRDIAEALGLKFETLNKWLYEGRAPDTKLVHLALRGLIHQFSNRVWNRRNYAAATATRPKMKRGRPPKKITL